MARHRSRYDLLNPGSIVGAICILGAVGKKQTSNKANDLSGVGTGSGALAQASAL